MTLAGWRRKPTQHDPEWFQNLGIFTLDELLEIDKNSSAVLIINRVFWLVLINSTIINKKHFQYYFWGFDFGSAINEKSSCRSNGEFNYSLHNCDGGYYSNTLVSYTLSSQKIFPHEIIIERICEDICGT